ncbi:MAG TPA: sugar ABC transporter ATP-binding protein [Bdellovibrionales bacterium]|nr:sugar ABC transporter ATP-binding protein [Bdellovibrionales bacterium]
MAELVKLSNITKTFPGVKAVDSVNLTIQSGEVLALVGENGAGKSTLMKVLSGVYPAGTYEGDILVDGQVVQFKSPLDAENAGIAIIHQELSPFAHLTVGENIFVGHWQTSGTLVDWDKLYDEADYWLKQIGAPCSARDPMDGLSVGTQQMVEIAKALSRKSRVLVLDEPTSALTPREVESLMKLIQTLRSEGKGLVYISHKMEEIYRISDRITVLRDGKTVHTAPTKDLPEDKLISHMVGRSLERAFPERPPQKLGEVVLRVKDFTGHDQTGKHVFGPINFELRRGEILGFAGLLGAGRTEMLKALFGDPSIVKSGEIFIDGNSTVMANPREGLSNAISYVSEDRKRESILPQRSLDENVSLSRLASGFLGRLLSLDNESARATESLKRLNTRCTGPQQEIQNLSGGNQQKVIIARALQVNPQVIILDEPTRGIDVGAKFEIYDILFKLAAEGRGLIVVSSDLPEIIGLCDRIVVLSEGIEQGILKREQFSQEAIMKLAVGARKVTA